jgi:viroplasmin and RNaseH domain-containing protein
MILIEENLGQLRRFYAVAVGWQSGIWGEWETARKYIDHFPKPVRKKCNNKRDAVEFIIEELTNRSKNTELNPDQKETLASCKTLVDDWERQVKRESLV